MQKIYSRSHANHGKKLEMLIGMTNTRYSNGGVADVRRVPTPVDIVKVTGREVKGRLGVAEWVDYDGVYKCYPIIFDAKESTLKNLPLKNISQHQYELLKARHHHGAIAFLVVCFWLPGVNEPEIYILRYEQLYDAWEKQSQGGAKSIPINYFREHCVKVKSHNGISVGYLAALNLPERA